MNRTLSRGNDGPDPRKMGSGPFLISTIPAATMACLSDARLCSLTSARGASPRWAIRCYGWGCLVARQSVYAGGAYGARRKRDSGSPQRPRIGPRDAIDGFRQQRACPFIRPCTPPPGTRPWRRASSRQGRAPGLWPSPSSAASGPGGAGPPPSSLFSGACYRPWRCRPGRLYRLGLIL